MIKLSGNAKDLTGQRFGHLVAVEPVGKDGQYIVWRCKCDCGGEIDAVSTHLLRGRRASCGCRTRSKGAAPKKSSLCMDCEKMCPWLLSFPAQPGVVDHFRGQGLEIKEAKMRGGVVWVVTTCPWFSRGDEGRRDAK